MVKHSRAEMTARLNTAFLILAGAGLGVARAADGGSVEALKTMSLDELSNLEVTSVSKRPQKLSETATAIAVITNSDIHRSGATSLPEALRLAGALELAQINAAQWAISTRGFNAPLSNKMLVLVDGRTIYSPLFSGVFWEAQDVMLPDVDRIEVISGPGATVWGANAVNGVINISSKPARDTLGLYTEAAAGTTVSSFGAIRYGGEISPDTQYRVYGQYKDRDSAIMVNGDNPGNALRYAQGGFRVDSALTGNDALTVQGDVYDSTITIAGPDELVTRGQNLLGRWTHRSAADSEFKLQLFVDRAQRGAPGAFDDTLVTYDLDFQHELPAGSRHNIVWGAGYRLVDDDFQSGAIGLVNEQVKLETFNAFIQDEIALVPDRWHLTLGTKLEDNDYTGFVAQPAVRLAWKLRDKQMLWSALSYAVRTPARIDRDYFLPPLILGSPDLQSEELIAYELGYRVQPHPRVSLSVAGYYHDYDDIRSIEPVNPPAPMPVEFLNGQQGESYGVELSLDYRVTDTWRLRADVSELRVNIRPKPGSLDQSFGSQEAADSRHHVLLVSQLDLPRNLQLDATARYVSRVENPEVAVDGYTELDLRFAWLATDDLEFSIVGQNLVHDQHGELGADFQRQEFERSGYAKVSWRF